MGARKSRKRLYAGRYPDWRYGTVIIGGEEIDGVLMIAGQSFILGQFGMDVAQDTVQPTSPMGTGTVR